jgi:hypothetical protein
VLGAAGTGWPTRAMAGGVDAGGAMVGSAAVGAGASAGAGTGAAAVAVGVAPVAAIASAGFGPQPLNATVAQAIASATRVAWVEGMIEFTIKMIADGGAAGHPTSATVGVGRC